MFAFHGTRQGAEKAGYVRTQGKRGVRNDDSMAQELLSWRALGKMKGKPPGIDRGEAQELSASARQDRLWGAGAVRWPDPLRAG